MNFGNIMISKKPFRVGAIRKNNTFVSEKIKKVTYIFYKTECRK
ncbi:hypothetical protein M2132_001612 [Dysgonomonas sp. PH5-45]|nr:hypothetical protein [Dysgonomonas sp. PH5-45]MDH6388201.1 hypothetical protein [Dysgonomonas sp. PH5-37]